VKRFLAVPMAMAVALAVTGCGGSSTGSSSSTSTPASSTTPTTSGASTVRVSTKSLPGLGVVLVDSQGRTLYSFLPDKHSKVTCVGACAGVWPPLKLASGQTAVASGQATSSMLGSDPDPAGGRVVTYAGWPLYTYVADTAPGADTGQALNLNGGLWYVLAPSGQVIHKKL
jgi:predicted lipoprotein with Yx(FWY)xxD motif